MATVLYPPRAGCGHVDAARTQRSLAIRETLGEILSSPVAGIVVSHAVIIVVVIVCVIVSIVMMTTAIVVSSVVLCSAVSWERTVCIVTVAVRVGQWTVGTLAHGAGA